MIRICSYCEIEGKPAVMGEKPPLEDKSRTDGICKAHRRLFLDPEQERAWHSHWGPLLDKKQEELNAMLKSLKAAAD